jgi:hypothetical protein
VIFQLLSVLYFDPAGTVTVVFAEFILTGVFDWAVNRGSGVGLKKGFGVTPTRCVGEAVTIMFSDWLVEAGLSGCLNDSRFSKKKTAKKDRRKTDNIF